MSTVAGILMVTGAVFVLLASVGVLRFPDTYARMHAASKGPSLGLLLVAAGGALELRSAVAVTTLGIAVVLQFLTTPVGTHVVARSVHRRDALDLDAVDELTRDEEARDEEAAERGGQG